jgi:carbon-monoxide dehydrogenase iron sulfur subunit
MPQKEIFVRVDRCMGCHSCELACAVEHSASKSLYTAITEEPAPKKRLYVEPVKSDSVPVLCRHCEGAPCIEACICDAISFSREGNVLTDIDKCIGCWKCIDVCPYGVIGRSREDKKIYRCDRCPDRDIPTCVAACPTCALVFQTVEDFSKNVRRAASLELVAGQGG